jgi:hypothetical protein
MLKKSGSSSWIFCIMACSHKATSAAKAAGGAAEVKRRAKASPGSLSKKGQLAQYAEVDCHVHCMCFGTHGEDIWVLVCLCMWLVCLCMWLHEDCAEDCITDECGKERCCSDVLTSH